MEDMNEEDKLEDREEALECIVLVPLYVIMGTVILVLE